MNQRSEAVKQTRNVEGWNTSRQLIRVASTSGKCRQTLKPATEVSGGRKNNRAQGRAEPEERAGQQLQPPAMHGHELDLLSAMATHCWKSGCRARRLSGCVSEGTRESKPIAPCCSSTIATDGGSAPVGLHSTVPVSCSSSGTMVSQTCSNCRVTSANSSSCAWNASCAAEMLSGRGFPSVLSLSQTAGSTDMLLAAGTSVLIRQKR